MKNIVLTAIFAGSLAFAADAEARPFRVDQIPNGSEISCGLCHVAAGGGGPRNGFGQQVEDTLNGSDADWSAIYDMDGDSDGYTNGEELGDPDGTWMIGDANPADYTNPADRDDNLCGDGILNGDEECDSDPMGAMCSDMGFGDGTVTCDSMCDLDYSACDGAPNNTTGNNTTANNTTANNTTANNNTGNNSTANNSTANNNTGNNGIDDGIVDDGMDDGDDDNACSTAGSTPGFLALVLGLFIFRRRRN